MKHPWYDVGLRLYLATCLFTGMTSPQAFAATFYVNANTGDDAREVLDAINPLTPWKTLSHALTNAIPGDLIQVADGLYDEANGESFPLPLKSGVSVVGAGPDAEIVVTGDRPVFESDGLSLDESTWLSNLTLDSTDGLGAAGGGAGVYLRSSDGSQILPSFDNITFADGLNEGLWLEHGGGPLEFRPTVENSSFAASRHGILINAEVSDDTGTILPVIAYNDFTGDGIGVYLVISAESAPLFLSPDFHDNRLTGLEEGLLLELWAQSELDEAELVMSPSFLNNTLEGLMGDAFLIRVSSLLHSQFMSDITVSENTATAIGGALFDGGLVGVSSALLDINWLVNDNAITFGPDGDHAIAMSADEVYRVGGQMSLEASRNVMTGYDTLATMNTRYLYESNLDFGFKATSNEATLASGDSERAGLETRFSELGTVDSDISMVASNNQITGGWQGISFLVNEPYASRLGLNLTAERNQIDAPKDVGLWTSMRYLYSLDLMSDVTVSENTVSGTWGDGLRFDLSSVWAGEADMGFTVTGNTVTDAGQDAVRLSAYSIYSLNSNLELTVEDNTITSPDEHAIEAYVDSVSYAQGTFEIAARGNTITRAAGSALRGRFLDFDTSEFDIGVTVEDNTMAQLDEYGVDLSLSDMQENTRAVAVDVTENQISDVYGGIRFDLESLAYDTADVYATVMGNSITRSTVTGVELSATSFYQHQGDLHLSVMGNRVEEAEMGANVRVGEYSESMGDISLDIRNNEVVAGSHGAIAASVAQMYQSRGAVDVSIVGNTATQCGYGIYSSMETMSQFARAQSVDISGNMMAGNTGHGIVFLQYDEVGAYDNQTRITDNLVLGNDAYGILLGTSGSNRPSVLVTGNTITDNLEAGFGQVQISSTLSDGPTADLGGGPLDSPGLNVIKHNGPSLGPEVNVVNEMSGTLFARYNDWGSTLPSAIDETLYDDDEDPALGAVDFGDYLSESPTRGATLDLTAELVTDMAPDGASTHDTFEYVATLRGTGDTGCAAAKVTALHSANGEVVASSSTTPRGGVLENSDRLEFYLGHLMAGETLELTWNTHVLPDASCSPLLTTVTLECRPLSTTVLDETSSDTDATRLEVTAVYYQDEDGDGFGSQVSTTTCSGAPSSYVTVGGDCNDGDSTIHPLATEAAGDEVDQNCDGKETCYVDQDGDGFLPYSRSTIESTGASCRDAGEAPSEAEATDCDDTKADTYPGAVDTPYDGIDQDCQGGDVLDADGDGVLAESVGGADCDDTDDTVWALTQVYADDDGDGIGDSSDSLLVCGETPPKYVEEGGDNCPNDANPNQADWDEDGLGDACDLDTGFEDTDDDGVENIDDNCPTVPNESQDDLDDDGIGDACDLDADGDEALANEDCNDLDETVSEWMIVFTDVDADGLGDNRTFEQICGSSVPEGWVTTAGDNCPDASNADQLDSDGDGYGDACDVEATPDGAVQGGSGCSSSNHRAPVGLAWWLLALLPAGMRRRRSR